MIQLRVTKYFAGGHGRERNTLLVHVNDTGSTATEYTDRDVTPDVLHAYRVKAINPAGLSGRSKFCQRKPLFQPAETRPEQPRQGSAGHQWRRPGEGDAGSGYLGHQGRRRVGLRFL